MLPTAVSNASGCSPCLAGGPAIRGILSSRALGREHARGRRFWFWCSGSDETPVLVKTKVGIFLTSGAASDDVRRANELAAAHLMKPVKQSEVFNAIVTSLGAGVPEAPDVHFYCPRLKIGPPPLRILLVEDSVFNQKMAVGLLEKHGHTVVVANNGREALSAVDPGRLRRGTHGCRDAGDGLHWRPRRAFVKRKRKGPGVTSPSWR